MRHRFATAHRPLLWVTTAAFFLASVSIVDSCRTNAARKDLHALQGVAFARKLEGALNTDLTRELGLKTYRVAPAEAPDLLARN